MTEQYIIQTPNILIKYNDTNCVIKLWFWAIVQDKLSSTTSSHSSQSRSSRVGTLKYQAPEISFGGSYDYRVDVYSLAIISMELFDIEIEE